MNKEAFNKYIDSFGFNEKIETVNDALKIFKDIKVFEKKDNEWEICKKNLVSIFNFDIKGKSKNQCYMKYQSEMVNNLFIMYGRK